MPAVQMDSASYNLRLQGVPEPQRARFWYESLAARLSARFPPEQWIWVAAAWALTQERGLSPQEGSRLVNAALTSDSRDLSELEVESSLHTDLRQLLVGHRMPSGWPSAYVCDLTDVLLGRRTRVVMGDDPRGGMPVPIDKWSYRDVGYVDAEVKAFVARNFGEAEAARLRIESLGEDEYEYCIRFYTKIADMLNGVAWLGATDWRPHQAEAIGRFSMYLQMKFSFAWPDALF